MKETKTIWLDETDLKRILTEKFKTDENSISFELIDRDGSGDSGRTEKLCQTACKILFRRKSMVDWIY